jgi:hypothetical protein
MPWIHKWITISIVLIANKRFINYAIATGFILIRSPISVRALVKVTPVVPTRRIAIIPRILPSNLVEPRAWIVNVVVENAIIVGGSKERNTRSHIVIDDGIIRRIADRDVNALNPFTMPPIDGKTAQLVSLQSDV